MYISKGVLAIVVAVTVVVLVGATAAGFTEGNLRGNRQGLLDGVRNATAGKIIMEQHPSAYVVLKRSEVSMQIFVAGENTPNPTIRACLVGDSKDLSYLLDARLERAAAVRP